MLCSNSDDSEEFSKAESASLLIARTTPDLNQLYLLTMNAARPEGRIKLGSLLAEIGQQVGGFDLEIEREKSHAEPMSFE